MARRTRDQALTTVLFTDIAASTRIASELGDRRWRVVLSRHNQIVREELRRYDGRELDTAGDGFYAVFDGPSGALRCAAAISDRVRELGIEIRAGVNFGETETIGRKPGGIAVHAASRIMSMAAPGEVLVSSTVRDIVPGSGFSFEDRGIHVLRDIPGEWRIYALTGIDGTRRASPAPEEVAAARRVAVEPPPLFRRRGAGVVAVGAVVVVLAAAIVIPLAARNVPAAAPSPSAATSPSASGAGDVDRLVKIDPTLGKVIATYRVGQHPGAVAFGEGAVWVANEDDSSVSRIDPASGRPTTIPLGADPDSITAGAEAIWAGESAAGLVSRIYPGTDRVVPIDLGIGVGAHEVYVAVDDATSSVWVAVGLPAVLRHPFEIGQIDPSTNTFSFVTKLASGASHGTLSAGAGSVWFAGNDGSVIRLDARTGTVVWQEVSHVAFYASTFGNGTVWLGSASQKPRGSEGSSGGAITPVSPTTNQIGEDVSLGGAPTGIAVLGEGVYVSDVLGVVHPYAGGAVLPAIQVGDAATGIAAGEGFLWVSVNPP